MNLRNKTYAAATQGNGSQSLDVNYGRVSMTPQPNSGNSGQEDLESNRPSSAPSTATANSTAQQHFASSQQPPSKPPAQPQQPPPTKPSAQPQQPPPTKPSSHPPPPSLKNPSTSNPINLQPSNQQPQQVSQSTGVSCVNQGARAGNFVATLGPDMGDGLINYGTSDGKKTHKRATASLKDEFDGTSDGSTIFRMQLDRKSVDEGWANGTAGDCVHIPLNGFDPSSGNINVINERTRVSEQAIRVWAMRNLITQSTDPNAITRKAQNNKNMADTIMNTLDKDCMATISLKGDRYIIGGVIVAALLFRVVMEGAELDTMVTSANIRAGLHKFGDKLKELKYNVTKAADFVRESQKNLHARGETTNDEDLVLIIFGALQDVPDADFSEHFKRAYMASLTNQKKYNVEKLLAEAELMYKVRVDTGLWGKLSKAEEELVAMQADFKDLNLRFKEEKKKNKKMRQSGTTSNNSSGSSRRNRSGPRLRSGEEWRLVNEDNKTKCERDGRTWYWCLNHNDGRGMWTIHKPADCRSRNRSSSNQNSSNSDEQAMPATVDEESDTDSDSESESSDF